MTSKKEDNGDHNRFKKKYNNWLSNIKLHSRRKIEYNKDENKTKKGSYEFIEKNNKTHDQPFIKGYKINNKHQSIYHHRY